MATSAYLSTLIEKLEETSPFDSSMINTEGELEAEHRDWMELEINDEDSSARLLVKEGELGARLLAELITVLDVARLVEEIGAREEPVEELINCEEDPGHWD